MTVKKSETHQAPFIDQTISAFISWHIDHQKVDPLDRIYLTNRLLDLLKVEAINTNIETTSVPESHLDMLDQLVEHAVDRSIFEDRSSEKDIFESKIMDIMTPRPSEVNRRFWSLYQQDKKQATDDFYQFSKESNYIKTREIAKNIKYTHETEYGDIEITINLSKPEKDPKTIALARSMKPDYPVNLLCMENEGYAGNLTHPARSNHRIIRMNVAGEAWGYQYSPYLYYTEHAIFLSEEHRAMHVGDQTITNLLDILTTFPHYFVGSNAGLPIVGGSILSHEHYQGGRHTFALERAEIEQKICFKELPNVDAGIVKWPMSVIRVQSTDKKSIEQAAKKIMDTWAVYTDETAEILSSTNGDSHNAITPIARKRKDVFELDLILRNNRTNEVHPDGIFHPHKDVQHIKKENIGLIEVMGLAILPPRLEKELVEVEHYLLGNATNVAQIHQKWAEKLKEENTEITEQSVKNLVQHAVGEVFLQVLRDAGVFKRNAEGKAAFLRFAKKLGTV